MPPVCASAADTPIAMTAMQVSPATARRARLLINLPLSFRTGLADGLGLKDRATWRQGHDSPQHWVPRSPSFSVWSEIQRKCARHSSRAPGVPTPLHNSVLHAQTFVAEAILPPPETISPK